MFCRNCSKELLNEETVCAQCGAPAGQGVNYCSNCGTYTPPNAVYCPRCGAPSKDENNAQNQNTAQYQMPQYVQSLPPSPVTKSKKNRLAVGIIAIVLGSMGIHNFYLGHKSRAIAQLLMTVLSFFTCGITAIASLVWSFVEGIQILSGAINHDAYGNEFAE